MVGFNERITMSLPKRISLPEARDFCKGDPRGNMKCTLHWFYSICPDNEVVERRHFESVWRTVADELKIPGLHICDIIFRNDHPNTKKSQLAQAFRLTLEKAFGYKVIE
jgi:hypothetical protein